MNHPLLHVANILYLASYSVRDILWLRGITVMAMVCLGFCYIKDGLIFPLCWQIAFLAINLFQIFLLVRERRPVTLTPMEQEMRAKALAPLTARQVKRFLALAQHRVAEPGEEILRENTENQSLILLTSGAAGVFEAGMKITDLAAGQFAGEMSFLTRCNTSASVEAGLELTYAFWDEDTLCEIAERDQSLGIALQSALGADVVYKLLDQRSRQVHGKPFDARGSLTLPKDPSKRAVSNFVS